MSRFAVEKFRNVASGFGRVLSNYRAGVSQAGRLSGGVDKDRDRVVENKRGASLEPNRVDYFDAEPNRVDPKKTVVIKIGSGKWLTEARNARDNLVPKVVIESMPTYNFAEGYPVKEAYRHALQIALEKLQGYKMQHFELKCFPGIFDDISFINLQADKVAIKDMPEGENIDDLAKILSSVRMNSLDLSFERDVIWRSKQTKKGREGYGKFKEHIRSALKIIRSCLELETVKIAYDDQDSIDKFAEIRSGDFSILVSKDMLSGLRIENEKEYEDFLQEVRMSLQKKQDLKDARNYSRKPSPPVFNEDHAKIKLLEERPVEIKNPNLTRQFSTSAKDLNDRYLYLDLSTMAESSFDDESVAKIIDEKSKLNNLEISSISSQEDAKRTVKAISNLVDKKLGLEKFAIKFAKNASISDAGVVVRETSFLNVKNLEVKGVSSLVANYALESLQRNPFVARVNIGVNQTDKTGLKSEQYDSIVDSVIDLLNSPFNVASEIVISKNNYPEFNQDGSTKLPDTQRDCKIFSRSNGRFFVSFPEDFYKRLITSGKIEELEKAIETRALRENAANKPSSEVFGVDASGFDDSFRKR